MCSARVRFGRPSNDCRGNAHTTIFVDGHYFWLTGFVDNSVGLAAFVLEVDLELDSVLADLAVLDPGGRLHDLDLADVAHRPSRGSDGLAGGIAPRARARADHLADDDDTHVSRLPHSALPQTAGRAAEGTTAPGIRFD